MVFRSIPNRLIASSVDWAYVPRFYEPAYGEDGTQVGLTRTRDDVPATIRACVVDDLDAIPLPTRPVVPFVETAHDRIAIEIMRGCPWQCRFCQSTVIKRPLRVRSVETIVGAPQSAARATSSSAETSRGAPTASGSRIDCEVNQFWQYAQCRSQPSIPKLIASAPGNA